MKFVPKKIYEMYGLSEAPVVSVLKIDKKKQIAKVQAGVNLHSLFKLLQKSDYFIFNIPFNTITNFMSFFKTCISS